MPLRADRVRELQRAKGYSNRHIATLIGVNENTVSRWANGNRQPGSLSLNQLAAVLEVSLDYLMGISDDPTPPSQEIGELSKEEQRLLWAFRRGGQKGVTRLFHDDD
jgi:transcriptional regulator with XRE-family HTH domain